MLADWSIQYYANLNVLRAVNQAAEIALSGPVFPSRWPGFTALHVWAYLKRPETVLAILNAFPKAIIDDEAYLVPDEDYALMKLTAP